MTQPQPTLDPDPHGLIERLAVVICYAAFINSAPSGGDPCAYWQGISETAREKYREMAARWLRVIRQDGWTPMPTSATESMCRAVARKPDSAISRETAGAIYDKFVAARPPFHWI
jgi:hypothetical protein